MGDAGAGDQDVGAAVSLGNRLGEALDRAAVGHVELGEIGLVGGLAQAAFGVLARVFADIGDDDLGPALGKRISRGQADASGAAGDDGDPTPEVVFLAVHPPSQ